MHQSLPVFAALAAGPSPPVERPGRVQFFTHTLCPYAERVFLTLLEKGVPFDLIHVNLSAKPSWFRAVNPAGLVPAVRSNGKTVTESLDILRWLDATFPPVGKLTGEERALQSAIAAGSKVITSGLDLVSGKGRYWGVSSGQSATQIEAFDASLRHLFATSKHQGPFVTGGAVSLADFAVYPFVNRFAILLPGLCGYNVRAAAGGRVGEWMEAMQARPSCQVTSPDEDLFRAAAMKGASLDFFDYMTYGVFDLHPHNRKYLTVREEDPWCNE
jgi:glutathione S-transferase